MTNFIGTLLTAMLQERGICADDYYKLSDAVTNALCDLAEQMDENDCVQLPNGRVLTIGKRPREIELT